MNNYKKTVKITYLIINLSIIILFALAVALPWLVTWYVEIKHKNAGLPALVMLTCYPSFPFAVVALFSLRKLLKNILNGLVFGDNNITLFHRVTFCCLVGAGITFIAGFKYLPFFVVSIACVGCALIVKTINDVFAAELDRRREELYETVRENL